MIRIADQIKKSFHSDVFIVIHNKDTDRISSHTTDLEFDLTKIAKLVKKDVEDRVSSKKVESYLKIDFNQLSSTV